MTPNATSPVREVELPGHLPCSPVYSDLLSPKSVVSSPLRFQVMITGEVHTAEVLT